MPPFRILAVCTGNICRSPMAQALLSHRLRARLGRELADAAFEVSSAGTYGLDGHGIERDALAVLARYRVVPDPFRSRELAVAHVETADLVLGATREHRDAAVALLPRISSRAFALREFARLIRVMEPVPVEEARDAAAYAEHARRLVATAAAARGPVPPGTSADDVPDPYRRDAVAFEAAGHDISAAVDVIVSRFAPPTTPR